MLGTRCHRYDVRPHARMQCAWHKRHCYYLQLHTRIQHAWHGCHHHACGLQAWMQHAWHGMPSLCLWAARMDAACLARDTIATILGCTHGCSVLGTRCHRYYLQLHTQMQHAWVICHCHNLGLHTRVQHAWHECHRCYLSYTYGCSMLGTRCRCGIIFSCTRGCRMLGTRCHC